MPENEIILSDAPPETATETAKEKFERERLSRRQALKKFGMTSAMATFALFSVDDLAHMVGKAMQQRAGDNRVAEQVAQEFQNAGIVLADPPGAPPLGKPCGGDSTPIASRAPCCTPDAVGSYCSYYDNYAQCNHCVEGCYGPSGYCAGYNNPAGSQGGQATTTWCVYGSTPA